MLTRLERGSASGVSEDVLEGIARALELDEAERAHLCDLFRTASTTRPARRRPSQERVRPTVQRIIDAMADLPAIRWAAHNVKFHRTGTKRLHHPLAGDLTLAFEAFELPGDPGQRLNIYTVEPGSAVPRGAEPAG
jgi:hypothetical protein